MREYNPLIGYPQLPQPRYVGPHIRTIRNRILASYRGRDYYDGDRNNGYGGFKYDGRWVPIAKNMYREYSLNESSAVLQVGCEKGFLLHDFHQLYPKLKVRGTEVSAYAIEHAMPTVKPYITQAPFTELPFDDGEFDLVIAIGVVYTLTLSDAISCLKEIGRVGRGKAFVTLGAYRDEEEFRLFRYWTVLGCTVLHVDDWVEVLKEAGYRGDYHFATAKTLNLVEKTS